jgi:hypothetical protein
MSRPKASLFAALLLLSFAHRARAEPDDAPDPRDEMASSPRTSIVDAAPPQKSQPPKRPVPSYSGRDEEDTRAAWLWIPRVVLFPFYLAADYLFRRPIGAIVMAVDHEPHLQRASGANYGAVPTLLYDAGFLPNVGVYGWWDGAGARTNDVRVHASTWGSHSSQAAVLDRVTLSTGEELSFRGSAAHRTDAVFFGLGPDSVQSNRSRYEVTTFEAAADYDRELAEKIRISTRAGVRDVSFGPHACCGTPSIAERVKSGQLARPPRFEDGYAALIERATVALDTHAARIAIAGEPGFDLSRHPATSWIKYDARASARWEVMRPGRILSLQLATLFTDPVAGGAGLIPFTELATLGGFTSMRGFVAGRLVDRSAAVATIEYAWPIWSFLEGTLDAAVGNVFGERLDGFAPKKLRLSSTFGVRSRASRDIDFDILTGIGTETFDHGADVTSFRLALGAHRAF